MTLVLIASVTHWVQTSLGWKWIATTLVALYGAVLATVNLARQRSKDRREVAKDEHSLNVWAAPFLTIPEPDEPPVPAGHPMTGGLRVDVTNDAFRPVTVTAVMLMNRHSGSGSQPPLMPNSSALPIKLEEGDRAIYQFAFAALEPLIDHMEGFSHIGVWTTLGQYDFERNPTFEIAWTMLTGTGSDRTLGSLFPPPTGWARLKSRLRHPRRSSRPAMDPPAGS